MGSRAVWCLVPFVLLPGVPGAPEVSALAADGPAWVEVAALPIERKNHTPGWAVGPYLFCMGYDSEDCWVTRQAKDGRLEPWTLAKKCGFTTSKWGNPCASLGPRVYAFGHWGTSRTAVLDAPGHMSPWKNAQRAQSMGTERKNEPVLWGAGTMAEAGRMRFLYHAGGFEYEGENFTKGRSQNKVFYAAIKPDGYLTDWAQTAPLPAVVMSPSIVFHEGWLYVFGGFSRKFAPDDAGNDRMVDAIFAGRLNPDGSVASWKTLERKLPWNGMGIAAFVHQGSLYIAGGEVAGDGAGTASSFSDGFARARLGDGVVGEWEKLDPLPAPTGKTPNGILGDTFYIVGLSQSGKTPVYAFRLPK